ncbi:hypothetical protein CWI75_14350 [Kineobactrum sediminis]|uniref:Glycosyltransferase 2-like domain-containing protein n=1 Tax=Kineobactrum sediminis TaxID=1905677 RepID=A0A2N5XZS2_9GAMM|nr:glycosyltransferase family A protein [Kineobactrum sediminis]PLW81647.1 hypothetical protein CWI75_14350 [Kineobactrum sediminis]
MKLSVIVIAYNMQREIPRTLQSLTANYQQGIAEEDYEVLVIDNKSPDPVDREMVESFGPNFRYFYLEEGKPSPAFALNFASVQARGDILCFMIDGAHILTPGVLSLAMSAFRAFGQCVVLTRYFYLGPGSQNETILEGYSKREEDRLLASIDWPRDGYRLFEIGAALQGRQPKITWLSKMFETNCLFLAKEDFNTMGRADERFDFPGGGFLNIDLYAEAAKIEGITPVQLVGEGSFHQLHGGITTNVTPEDRDAKVERYHDQYRVIRGADSTVTDKNIHYLGHVPTEHAKIHRRSRPIK